MCRKRNGLLLAALLCALCLTGCAAAPAEAEIYDWGLEMTASDVTATGATLCFAQSGGAPTGQLQTGSEYVIETLRDGQWAALAYAVPDGTEIAWTAEAWLLPLNNSIEYDVDWGWLYGELPSGTYRIGKPVMDFRGAGDYDTAMVYAEFAIK